MLNVETVLHSCVLIWTDYDCLYLKHSQKGLGEVVKGTPLGLGLVKVELPTKDLHAQQREDDDEEEEQQQQGGDGLHGVQQRSHQVAQGLPVTVNNHRGAEMSESQVIQWAPHIHSTHTHRNTHTHSRSMISFSPRDLEDPQQADAAEHRDTERRHDFQFDKDGFSDSSAHHKAVEAVEQWNKIRLQTETVHLHQHFTCEEGEQHLVGHIWNTERRFKIKNKQTLEIEGERFRVTH